MIISFTYFAQISITKDLCIKVFPNAMPPRYIKEEKLKLIRFWVWVFFEDQPGSQKQGFPSRSCVLMNHE
jgi:hypothetical protein